MYIPGWVLILCVVLALFASERLAKAAGKALQFAFRLARGALWLLCVGYSIYCLLKGGTDAIWTLSGMGLYLLGYGIYRLHRHIVAARQLRDAKGRLRVSVLKRLLHKHERQLSRLSNAASVVEARTALAVQLDLQRTLFDFYMLIGQFLDFHSEDGDPSWSSRALPRDKLGLVPLADLTKFGWEVLEAARTETCVAFTFSTSESSYEYRAFLDDAPGELPETPGWEPKRLRILVFDPSSTLLLDTLVLCDVMFLEGKLGSANFRDTTLRNEYGNLNAFRPGTWLVELLRINEQANLEYESGLQAWRNWLWKERAKNFA